MPTNSCSIGLAIGQSFAELSATGDDRGPALFQQRWYLQKRSLSEGLKEALKHPSCANGGRILVASDSVERILEKNQGRAPAVLVTTGFESWLQVRKAKGFPIFTQNSRRAQLPTEDDFIFGVPERIGPDGKIVDPLSLDDLEFLAAKLKLLKIQDVAICFRHSAHRPDHELSAASFMSDRGFRTFASHLYPLPVEEERWQRAIECAFSEAAILDEKSQLESAVKAAGEIHQLQVWTSAPKPQPLSDFTAPRIRNGLKSTIDRALLGFAGAPPSAIHLHCAFDSFRIVGSDFEIFSPTQLIGHGIWPFPHFTSEIAGYEPGPMLFGKSHQLAALDLMYVRERLQNIEGFSTLLSEKSRQRILETLFTFAKSPFASPGKRPPDAHAIAAQLESAFVENVALALAAEDARGEVVMSGPLAESFVGLLRTRRPDLKFSLSAQAAWAESLACLHEVD